MGVDVNITINDVLNRYFSKDINASHISADNANLILNPTKTMLIIWEEYNSSWFKYTIHLVKDIKDWKYSSFIIRWDIFCRVSIYCTISIIRMWCFSVTKGIHFNKAVMSQEMNFDVLITIGFLLYIKGEHMGSPLGVWF